MKKIMIIMMLVLIAGLAGWASVIAAYANSSRTFLVPTPTPAPTQPLQGKEMQVTPTVSAQQGSHAVYQGNSNLPEVALTFDDGPNLYYTPQVLTILRRYGVHATFFAIGQNVQLYPELVQREYNEDHIIGNHSWSHPNLTERSSASVHSQLSRTSDIIQQTLGIRPALFRPPYGALNAQVGLQASQLGLTPILWNVDTRDWDQPHSTVRVIVNNVLNEVGNGGIILMHDGGGDRSRTIAALPEIITTLQQRGYRLVTVPQLLNDMQGSGASAA